MKAHTEYRALPSLPAWAALLPLLASACGSGPHAARPVAAAVGPKAVDGRESARLVEQAENRTIGALASVDGRLAARMGVVPSEEELGKAAMGAVLHGDEGVAVVKGATDLFSFDVRARRIGEEAALLARRPELAEAAPVAVAGAEAAGAIQRPALEWELLGRLVAEEEARLEEEKQLPRSASELVRGLVATWAPPASMQQAKERDTWLARRLDEVVATLAPGPRMAGLRPVDVTELEGALDPLEHLADPMGFPRVQASMTRLRVALGQLRLPPAQGEGWEALEREMRAHLGVVPDRKALRSMLEELAMTLRAEASAALGHLSYEEAREVRGSTRLLAASSCGPIPGSRVRSFLPPPERAPMCAALQSLRDPRGLAGLAALVGLADDVTLAIWAIEISGDGHDPYRTVGAHPLLSLVAPEDEGPLMRAVATRPLLPLGVAFMARLLVMEGPDDRAGRVAKWLAFGDAPLDVVARELGLAFP